MDAPYKEVVIKMQVCYKGYGLELQTTSQLDALINSGWRVISQKTISYCPAVAIVTMR